jgi:hypothetical protein
MIVAIMMYPTLVTGNFEKEKKLSNADVMELLQGGFAEPSSSDPMDAMDDMDKEEVKPLDPMAVMQEAIDKAAAKKAAGK